MSRTLISSANLSIFFTRRYNIPLSDDEEYDTLGGCIFGKLGKRPKVGDVLELPGHTLETAEVDGLRIQCVH
jgi:CBS domain containing-hemolysin-like protein